MAERDDVAWLEGLSPWPTGGFGLERMHELLAALDHPEAGLPAVHVVGTNGKSTTTRMVEALLLADGRRAGAYLSPHVRSWAERIRIDGEEADLAGRARSGSAGGRTARCDPVRGADRGRARRVPCGQRRRGGRRSGARRAARCDERPRRDAGRRPHERLARAHRGARVDARGDRGGEARSRPSRLHGRARRARVGGGRPYGRRRPRRRRRGRARRRSRPRRRRPSSARRSTHRRSTRSRSPADSSGVPARSATAPTIPRACAGWSSGSGRRSTRWWRRSSGTRTSSDARAVWPRSGTASSRPARRTPARSPPTRLPTARAAGSRPSRRETTPSDALALAHGLGEPVLVTGSLYLLADLEERDRWR